MKKLLERQLVFNIVLRVLAFFAQRSYLDSLTRWATRQAASLNVYLNKPQPSDQLAPLAEAWQSMMPPDGQEFFKLEKITADTAYAQIHLHCPLRGTGDVNACHKLMNYDRELMRTVGAQLVVLESQSNSGKPFCRLAIRPLGQDASDLIPAHQREDSADDADIKG